MNEISELWPLVQNAPLPLAIALVVSFAAKGLLKYVPAWADVIPVRLRPIAVALITGLAAWSGFYLMGDVDLWSSVGQAVQTFLATYLGVAVPRLDEPKAS